MTYTTPALLLSHYGANELAQLADPGLDSAVSAVLLTLTIEAGDRSAYTGDEIAAADAALVRIDNAIAAAGREANSYITPRYTLPLTQLQIDASPLEQHCADMARYRLAEDRATEEIEKRYNRAIAWLKDLAKGMASLGEGDAVAATSGRMIAREGVSRFDWDTY